MYLATRVPVAGVLIAICLISPVIASDPPATTYHPGFWQPAARVNPKAPIKVVVVNQGTTSLQYDFSKDNQNTEDLQLLPGKSTIYENGSNPLPVYLNINSNKNDFQVKYEISVKNNVVTVKVLDGKPKEEGDTVLAIDTTGAIYFY